MGHLPQRRRGRLRGVASRAMTATAPPADATKTQILRWVFERINAHDIDSLRPFWTAETMEYFPDATCHGSDEIAAYFEDKIAAIENFHLQPIAIAEDGDNALVHWYMTGRHVGVLLGVAPTGRAIELDGIDHFVFSEGKVVSNTVVFDQMKFARQIGLLPPDRSAADRAVKALFNAKTRATARLKSRSAG